MATYTRFIETGKKIIAVGRNYKDHARELGNELPSKPLLFMKPTSAYITEGNTIKIPEGCKELHHEVELGVVIGKRGTDVPEKLAMDHVGGYALALDMTARDFQMEAKNKGNPWLLAKGFDTSCPISKFFDVKQIPNPHNVTIWCKVNGNLKQKGKTSDMIFSVPALISYISLYFTLEPGDLILTGTPAGVSPVKKGDIIEAGLDDIMSMSFKVESKIVIPN